MDRDDAVLVEPDALEDEVQEAALGVGVLLVLPEDREVFEDQLGLVEVRCRLGGERVQLGVDGVASGDVLGALQVAELVEVARSCQALFEGGAACGGFGALGAGGVCEAAEDLLADALAGGEAGDELCELVLDVLGLGDRLVAGAVGAAGGAVVAGLQFAAAGGALHAGVAAPAVRDAAQQVARGGAAGVEVAGALAAHLLDAVEEGLVDERLVESFDRLAVVAAAGDVAGVGGVAEHLADGVHAERAAARGALLVDVQPRGERAVGVLAGGVHLEQPLHVWRLVGVWCRDAIATADVAPGEAAGEEPLAGLLAQAHLGPEGERDRVVLVEDLVHGLREERGGVVRV